MDPSTPASVVISTYWASILHESSFTGGIFAVIVQSLHVSFELRSRSSTTQLTTDTFIRCGVFSLAGKKLRTTSRTVMDADVASFNDLVIGFSPSFFSIHSSSRLPTVLPNLVCLILESSIEFDGLTSSHRRIVWADSRTHDSTHASNNVLLNPKSTGHHFTSGH